MRNWIGTNGPMWLVLGVAIALIVGANRIKGDADIKDVSEHYWAFR